MVKILIADDHPIIRQGLKQIISDEEDMMVAGEAETGMQAIELSKSNQYDILILDINLPDMNGLEILKIIKASVPELPVLILSVYPEDQYAIRSIKSGASGYLNKFSANIQLINAIRKIISGENYLSPSLSNHRTS